MVVTTRYTTLIELSINKWASPGNGIPPVLVFMTIGRLTALSGLYKTYPRKMMILPLTSLLNLLEDRVSLQSITEFWRICLSQRMCLACYNEVDSKKTLVGMNVCVVDSPEERLPTIEIEGHAWINVYKAMEYIETKCDPFKYLGETKLLHALGLVIRDDYRGHKLGSRILAAREPLALSQGINATATVFTGPASQISAERCGFETICVVSLKELADQGLNYPSDENRVIKLMVKRFK